MRRRVNLQKIREGQGWIDRAIESISPEWALRRFQARATLAMAGGYVGGSRKRKSMENWTTTKNDADGDILPDLPTLRERCRDLSRNNPIAGGAVNGVVTSVVGAGLKPKPCIDQEVLGMTEEEADAWEKNTLREFLLWAESKDCDIERGSDFFELQDLAFRQVLENGDAFALLPYHPSGTVSLQPYDLGIQLIEADRICNKDNLVDTTTLAGGVEKTEAGAPIAYHVLKQHPGAGHQLKLEWDIVPAFGARTGRRNVHHLFFKLRPGQSRGVPYLTPVIEGLRQIAEYSESELEAAAVSAMFTVFVTSQNGEGLAPAGTSNDDASRANSEYQLGPAAMLDLAPGEDVRFAEPARPNANFDPFVNAWMRQVGIALEIPHEVLTKHFTSSYSAARAALLEAWKFFSKRRKWLAKNFCQPVYETWLTEAIAIGRVEAPGYLNGDPAIRKAYSGCKWIGPARGMIDEVKEITAAEKRVAMTISTLEDESEQLTGEPWEPKLRQRAKEKMLLDEAGLSPQPAATSDPNDPADKQDQQDKNT